MEENKENKRPSTPKRNRAEKDVLSGPLLTPRREQRKSAMKVMDSPSKTPVPEDFNPLSEEYVVEGLQDQYSEKKNRLKSIFMGFLNQTLLQEWGCEYDAVKFHVRKNSIDDPFQLLSINTHRTFCDRNENYEGPSVEGFANCLTQCCSQATRREGVSVIFLRNPSKIHLAGVKDRYIFCRTSEASPRHSEFRVELAPRKVKDICEAIEKIYINAPKGGGRNRTIVINTGFFTVEEKGEGARRVQKKMAVITSNGIYSAREARIQMGKIEKAIKEIAPEIEVLVIDPSDVPRVKHSGTLEHCETVYSDLMSNISSPASQDSPRRALFNDGDDEDEEALRQIDKELRQIEKIRLHKRHFSKKLPSGSGERMPLSSIPLKGQDEWGNRVNPFGGNRVNKVGKSVKEKQNTSGGSSEGKEKMAGQNKNKGSGRANDELGNKVRKVENTDEKGWIKVSYNKKRGNKSTSPTADRERNASKNKSRKAGGRSGRI